MPKKKELFSEFTDLPAGILEKSLTFKDAADLTEGSNVKCQCGWRGIFKETAELRFYNGGGDRTSTLYLCRKTLHILAAVTHDPPIAWEQQLEVADKKRAK